MKIYLYGWKKGKTTAFAKERVHGKPVLFNSQWPSAELGQNGSREELVECVREVMEQRKTARHGSDKLGSAS